MSDAGATKVATKRLSWWRYLPWVLAASCLIGLIWWRFFAEVSDFGFRNVLSYILIVAIYLSSVIGLILTSSWRAWLAALLVPAALIGIVLALFRVERVDSEIVPVLVWRGTPVATLPDVAPMEPMKTETAPGDSSTDSFFAKRATDYIRFLGPDANATLPSLELETNWKENAPQILWKQPIGKGWSGFAVQGDAAFTMEQRDQEEWVTCYDANTGKLKWHYAIPNLHFNPLGGTGPRSTPTIHNDRIYAHSAVSELVCLDMKSGSLIWSADLLKLSDTTQKEMESEVSWGRSGSPLIVDDKVIIPFGGKGSSPHSLIAFDAATGKELWRGGAEQISYSTPTLATLDGESQLLYVGEKTLSAFSVSDGKQLWSTVWLSKSSGDANVSQPIVVDETHLLMSKGYGGGAQLLNVTKSGDQWKTEVAWKSDGTLRTKFTSCVVKDGFAFGLSDGILECVNLKDGKRAWKKGRYRHGQVLLVGSTLLITAEDGSVVLVAADGKEHRELAKLQVIGDVTWNTAALSGNRLLMRNSDEAACVILPMRTSSTEASTSKENAVE